MALSNAACKSSALRLDNRDEELNELVDNLLLLHMLLSEDSNFAPQSFVLLLYRTESCIQMLLPPSHVLHFIQHARNCFRLGSCLLGLWGFRRSNFAFDMLEQVGMSLLEIGMRELHFVPVEFKAAVVDRCYLVESVHVQLTNEARHVVVFVVER